MKKIILILFYTLSNYAFCGDLTGIGGGRMGMVDRHFDFPFNETNWDKYMEISNLGDGGGAGGGSQVDKNIRGPINPYKELYNLGLSTIDGGGGRSNIRNFFKESRIENEFSGGIIGTLSGASAE